MTEKPKANILYNIIKGDRVIWGMVILLLFASIVLVYSTTNALAYKYQQGNTLYYLIKHFGIVTFGLLIIYGVHLIPYKKLYVFTPLILFTATILLILTLFMGTNINEADRWLSIPFLGISFQTSDVAKLAIIMYIARSLSLYKDEIQKFGNFEFKNAILPIVMPMFVICGLIFKSNFSTTALIFTTCMIVMFIGNVNIKYLLSIAFMVILGFSIFILALSMSSNSGRLGTWQKRIDTFLSSKDDANVNSLKMGRLSDANYQVEQSKIAIALGGLVWGLGPGNSIQRNFLPHPYSDFIYAIIIEEYGVLISMALLFIYMIIMYRAYIIFINSTSIFAALLAFGLSFSLVFQALINMAVAVNLIPVTGQPLPFISMGGTSIWFSSISVGIILSVSREVKKTTE